MKKVKTIRMPDWMESAIEDLAKKDDRTFSYEVLRRLKDSLKRDGVPCQ